MMLQKDRVALITGAARGLGWGIARAFGIAGARVCVTDISDDELARCARDLAADGTDFQTCRSDVADLAECKGVVKRIMNRWGRLDVVVHNAIYMPLIPFEATTPEQWSRQINVGIGGLFNCAYAVWGQMKAQRGGHIIGIASGSSIRGYKEEVAYCTIKHGIEGFVKALSLEGKPHNIALNTIGPGIRIKPTRMTWAEYDRAPAELRASWVDPVELGKRGYGSPHSHPAGSAAIVLTPRPLSRPSRGRATASSSRSKRSRYIRTIFARARNGTGESNLENDL